MTTIASFGRDDSGISCLADIRELEAEGWPANLAKSTYELLRHCASRFGDAPAISFFLETATHRQPETLSYIDLLDQVTRAANAFHRVGVGPDDVVALILPNLIETQICLWGGEAAGIVFPVNPLLEAGAITDLLVQAKAKVVVTVAPFPGVDLHDKVVAAVQAAPDVETVVLVELARHVRGLRRWPATILQLRLKRRASVFRPGVKTMTYAHAVQARRGDRLESGREISGSEIASMFGTGGTTGAPKLALRSHANEVANAWMSSRMTMSGLQPDDTVFCGLPLFHVNGAMVTGLAAFILGTRVLIGTPQGFRGAGVIERFWEIAQHHRVTSFSGVPTLFAALLQQPVAGFDLQRLSFGICGAAPMSPALIDRFQETTKVKVLEGYGLTEATCVAAVHALDGPQKVGAVGLPLPFQRVRIGVFDDEGCLLRFAVSGETGSVLLSGPNVFRGYSDSRHEQSLWVNIEGERWLDTGDLGTLDADGFLWLKGRSKDLIIRGGHNIDPAMIEDAFYSHPAVELAAAIGRPDAHAGEVPVVYVQLKPGAQVSLEQLADHAVTRIHERAARPKAVYITEALPLTAIGKVHKPSLRERDATKLQNGQL